jgi:hypothetical protein
LHPRLATDVRTYAFDIAIVRLDKLTVRAADVHTNGDFTRKLNYFFRVVTQPVPNHPHLWKSPASIHAFETQYTDNAGHNGNFHLSFNNV